MSMRTALPARLGRALRWMGTRVGAAVMVTTLISGSVGAYAATLLASGNFHTVISGELYRAGQPTPATITAWRRDYGIRTIINLRGENTGAAWYDAEVAAAKRNGVELINFRMSAKRILTQEQAEKLVALMTTAPKPLLIHCQGGADRTGLASALYLAVIGGHSEAAAERQISIRFGHFSAPMFPAFAMDRSFEQLEPWLGFGDS